MVREIMEQPFLDFDAQDQDYTPSQEDALRVAMKRQWDTDVDVIRQRGVIPDWMGEPSPLSRDKARLLSLLYEVGYIAWHKHPGPNNRDVTKRMGLNNTGNAKAVIDMCIDAGLVSSRIYRGETIFEMTMEGEHSLEEYELEVELGILQV